MDIVVQYSSLYNYLALVPSALFILFNSYLFSDNILYQVFSELAQVTIRQEITVTRGVSVFGLCSENSTPPPPAPVIF